MPLSKTDRNEFKELMNGNSDLSPEDQTAIVLRKIFFYLELLNIFLKQQATVSIANQKLALIFGQDGL